MKFLSITLFIVTLFFFGCKKSHTTPTTTATYMNTATITGPSLLMNYCSGAYFIDIDSVTNTTFNSLPASSGIDLTTSTFPIHIKLNWHYIPGNNCHVIIVDDVALD